DGSAARLGRIAYASGSNEIASPRQYAHSVLAEPKARRRSGRASRDARHVARGKVLLPSHISTAVFNMLQSQLCLLPRCLASPKLSTHILSRLLHPLLLSNYFFL